MFKNLKDVILEIAITDFSSAGLALPGYIVLRCMLQFGGLNEHLLTDELFLTKVVMEYSMGILTKV
jgi:hypothetical protein